MKLLLLLSIYILALAVPVSANTLVGAVQYHNVEGRIGVKVGTFGGKVERVHPNSPAQLAGLMSGDQIVSVDGEAGAIHRIQGTPGTYVHIKVKRAQQDLFFSVPRIDFRDIAP